MLMAAPCERSLRQRLRPAEDVQLIFKLASVLPAASAEPEKVGAVCQTVSHR